MGRYSRRVDRNHVEIKTALIRMGYWVADMSSAGRGVPDLIAIKAGKVTFIEVKDGAKVPSKQKLTAAQETWHEQIAAAGYPVVVVRSLDDLEGL